MYIIHFMAIPPGSDALVTARKIAHEDDIEMDAESSLDLNRVADAAVRSWPALVREEMSDDGSIEMNLNQDTLDLPIELFESGALIYMPDRQLAVLDQDFWTGLSAFFASLQFHTGWISYDPQLDRILNFPNDMHAVRKAYEQHLAKPQEPNSSSSVPFAHGRIKPLHFIIFLVALVIIQVVFYQNATPFKFLRPLLTMAALGIFLYFGVFRRRNLTKS